jgi:hypothetical protein
MPEVEMPTIKDVFIGRNQELEHLSQLLAEHPVLCVSLQGYGGVGKTKLVQTIQRSCGGNGQTIPIYIDFDDIHNRRIGTFEDRIVRIYGEEPRKQYHMLKQAYRFLENKGLFENNPDVMEDKRNEVLQLVRPPAGKNLLLIFDTFERVEERLDKSGFLDALFKWLRHDLAQYDVQTKGPKPAIQVIFSGRPYAVAADRADIDARMKQLFGKEKFEKLKIEPFSSREISDFFATVDEKVLDGYLGNFLDFNQPEVIQKLQMLTEGKPIFLGLVATLIVYQKEKWSGNMILGRSLQEICASQTRHRHEFQKSLLAGLQGLGSDVSYAILYMSIMKDFPADDPALWQKLLSLSESNARTLMQNLSSLFFVRENFTLHDELIRLIRRHLWQDFAPVRAHVLPLLVQATEKRITILQDKIASQVKASRPGEHENEPVLLWDLTQWKEELQADQFQALYYDLLTITRRSSPQEQVLRRFKELRDQAQDITSRRRLQEIVEDKLYWKYLSPEFKAEIDILKNRILNEEGGQRTLYKPDTASLSTDGKIAALCTTAFSQMSEDPAKALTMYQRALELARAENITSRLAEVHNYLGMTCRRLLLFEQAIEHFKESIRLYKELNNSSEKAASENNLAYVYRLRGDYEIASHFAMRAFTTRQENNDQIGLAYSNQTLGELHRDKDELETARKYFTEAKRLFASRSMDQNVAQVNIHLAKIARKQHFPSLVEELLNESIRIFERLNDQNGLADAQNEYGCELRKRGHELSRTQKEYSKAADTFRDAEKCYINSIELAKSINYWYRLTDSLSDLALLYRYWYENKDHDKAYLLKAQETAYQAVRLSRRHHMTLPESRAMEALGDVYYAREKYFKAFIQFYLPSCLLLADDQGHTVWRYRQIFDRVHRRMLNSRISETLIRHIAAYMAERWTAEGKAQVAPGFLSVLYNIAELGN